MIDSSNTPLGRNKSRLAQKREATAAQPARLAGVDAEAVLRDRRLRTWMDPTSYAILRARSR